MSKREAAVPFARPALLIVGLLLRGTNLHARIASVAPILETLHSVSARYLD